MANEPIQAKLILLDRNTYEAWKDAGTLSDTGLYIVREENSATNNMLTFCVGEGTQTEIMDITQNLQHDEVELSFDDQNNTYNLPPAYQIKGKLWFVQQTGADRDVYHVFMWNGERFLDCFGEPNNLSVVAELPDVGVTNNAYILRGDSENILYVFDGTDYQVVGDVLRPDNITIKFNSQNQIKGVGAFGMDATIGGTTYTAKAGSEIFNYVDGATTNNIATGNHSHASGISNIVTGDYSSADGVGDHNTVVFPTLPHLSGGYDQQLIGSAYSTSVPEAYRLKYVGVSGFGNHTFGLSNSVRSDNAYCVFLNGNFNDARFESEYAWVFGFANTVQDTVTDQLTGYDSDTFQSYYVLVGSYNSTRLVKYSEYTTLIGYANSAKGENMKYNFALGQQNTIGTQNSAQSQYHSYAVGKQNYITNNGSSYSTPWGESNPSTMCFAFGESNNIYNSCYSYVFGKQLYVSGSSSTFMVGYNNPHGSVGLSGVLDPDGGTNDYVTDGLFVVANGVNSATGDGLALVVRDEGISPAYTSQTGHTYSGNFTAWDGTCLRTYRHTIPSAAGNMPVFSYYPENSSEYVFEGQVKSISLYGAMDKMAYNHGDEKNRMWYYVGETGPYRVLSIVPEYSCVLMFRPTSDATLENMIVPIEDTNHNISTIYVMNPDFDISTVSVVHAFIYRDGFNNMCVIYSGYMEQPSA